MHILNYSAHYDTLNGFDKSEVGYALHFFMLTQGEILRDKERRICEEAITRFGHIKRHRLFGRTGVYLDFVRFLNLQDKYFTKYLIQWLCGQQVCDNRQLVNLEGDMRR